MIKETLISRTIQTLSTLPNDKIQEASDFIDFLSKKYDEEVLQKGIEKLMLDSPSFYFLNEEEDLYLVEELKEKY